MLKKFAISTAAATSALIAMPPPADAQSHGFHQRSGYGAGPYARRHDDRRLFPNRRFAGRYDGRLYGNDDGRRCTSGTTGTILGAVVGGLLGREIAGRGDRTVGTIIGGAAVALGGRAVDRDCRR